MYKEQYISQKNRKKKIIFTYIEERKHLYLTIVCVCVVHMVCFKLTSWLAAGQKSPTLERSSDVVAASWSEKVRKRIHVCSFCSPE